MATRVYVRSEGTPDITPSSWNFANQINPVSLPGTLIKNTGSAMTSKTEATGTTNPTARAMGRTIIGPLKAQTINGTVKGQMRGQESNAGANATLALAIKIIKPDGTDRGVLLAQTASDAATAGNELATSLTNAMFKDASESASITLSSVVASDGDYLVIEWGFRSATAVSRNITLSYGNDSATDLPEDTSTTAANNPWFEFSTSISIVRETVGASDGLGSSSVIGAATASSTGETSGTAGGSGVAAAFSSTVGTSTGETIAAAVSGAVWACVGTSSGTGLLNGEGTSLAASVGQSEGIASLSGSSTSIAEAQGQSGGIATSDYLLAAFTQSVAEASGLGSSSVIGLEIHWANGSAVGLSTVSGIAGEEQEGSVGNSIGTALVLGVATSINSSVFTASGLATVLGVGGIHRISGSINIPPQDRSISMPRDDRSSTIDGDRHNSIKPDASIRSIRI